MYSICVQFIPYNLLVDSAGSMLSEAKVQQRFLDPSSEKVKKKFYPIRNSEEKLCIEYCRLYKNNN